MGKNKLRKPKNQDIQPSTSGSMIKGDERFSTVVSDPRFKSYKPDAKHVELDKRFEKILDNRKFEVKDDLFFQADSSSSDESSSDEEEEIEEVDEWEEEDRKCYKDDTEETNRIAICNLDWDRITATDIFVLLHSFKPASGDVISVKIFPSEFGKQRLADEKLKGPKELVEMPEDVGKEDERTKMISTIKYEQDDDEEMNKLGYVQNKLRKYQLNRLRYYYAVAEFDCTDTAVEIYEQLDGFEYLASSVTIDLRFIPSSMSFDEDEPTSECFVLPDLNFYQAPAFINTALQQTKVRLTWEENDQDMSKKLVKAFEDVEANKEVAYLDDYLASDTENDDDSVEDLIADDSDDEEEIENSKDRESTRINKYKNLLKSIEEEAEAKKKEKSKFDIEINFGPELDEKQSMIDQDSDDEAEEEFDPDMTDEKREKLKKKESYKISNKKKKKQVDKDENQDKGELDLLLMGDQDDDKKHFNYANFVENDKQVNKNKKSKKINQDTFKFNAEDPRFNAIYESPSFNVDPSNPKFKRTKAFKEIIQKKIKK